MFCILNPNSLPDSRDVSHAEQARELIPEVDRILPYFKDLADKCAEEVEENKKQLSRKIYGIEFNNRINDLVE